MKKIKIFAAAVMFCAATFAGYTAYEKATMTDAERMMLANIEALTIDRNEIITMTMNDHRDNPTGCSTEKQVEVTLDTGEVGLKLVTVRGLENTCKYEKGSSCTAFACYSQN